MTPAGLIATLIGLDERDRRRPFWTPGTPILLANGQHWTFAPPGVRLETRAFGCGPMLNVEWRWGDDFAPGPAEGAILSQEYERLLLAFGRAGSKEDKVTVLFDLAALVLLRNYALSPPEALALLVAGAEHDRLVALGRELTEAVVDRPLEAFSRACRTIPYATADDYRRYTAEAN